MGILNTSAASKVNNLVVSVPIEALEEITKYAIIGLKYEIKKDELKNLIGINEDVGDY